MFAKKLAEAAHMGGERLMERILRVKVSTASLLTVARTYLRRRRYTWVVVDLPGFPRGLVLSWVSILI